MQSNNLIKESVDEFTTVQSKKPRRNLEEMLTPQKPRVETMPGAPKKSRRNFDEMVTPQKPKVETIPDAPKKPRRNFDELATPQKPKVLTMPDAPKKPRRNFDDMIFDEKPNIRDDKEHSDNPFQKVERKNKKDSNVLEIIKIIPQKKNVNINDKELFPELNTNSTIVPEIKKSAWNVFNPSLLEGSNIPKNNTTFKNPLKVIVTVSENITKPTEKIDSDEEYSEENSSESDEFYIEPPPEDSDIEFMRELYFRYNEVAKEIDFIKKTMNYSDIKHCRFLRQKQIELINLEEEISYNESIDDEINDQYILPYYNNY
jgi:hypothetical protein